MTQYILKFTINSNNKNNYILCNFFSLSLKMLSLIQFGVFLFLMIGIFEAKCDPIRTFRSTYYNPGIFHLAQVIPAGRYKVIIWDRMNGQCDGQHIFHFRSIEPRERYFFWNSFLQLNKRERKKCFNYFYEAQTDEEGRFLMRKNSKIQATNAENILFQLYLIPFKENWMPIAFGPGEFFAAQKVYFRGISEPIDSLCHFSAENLCLLKYLEDGDVLTAKVHNVMSEWLTNEFYQKLPEKEDFFLVTYFRHLIGEAKSNENADSKMPKESAAHLGIFWEYLRNSQTNEQLWKRMRLADGQMMHLIDQLCQIEYSYLFNHDPFLINNLTESADDNLCSSWQNERILAKQFADIPSVLSAFDHWIYFRAPISSQLQLIVRSWVEQFVIRTAHNDNSRCWWDWPEFDLALFQEIGLFFANARNSFSLTSEKFARIDGIKQLLDSVCDNIKNAWGPCPQHSATFAIIQQWNTGVCVNGKLRYKAGAWRRGCCEIASPSSRKRSHQQTQLDNINSSNSNENEKDGKKCIICLEGERQFAFDPCGHLCCCEECADKIEKNEPEPNCPICREIIDKKIRIFHP